MPGELVILNEQLQMLFPICDEIGIIIQQECGINIPVVVVSTKLPYTCDIMFDDATVRLSFKNKKFIYIKTTVKGSSIVYNRKTMSPF